MERKQSIYRAAVNGLLRFILSVVVFVLFLHSIFSTSFIGHTVDAAGNPYDTTFNIADSPWRHLLVFVLLSTLCAAVCKICRKCGGHPDHGVFTPISGRRATLALSAVLIVLGLFWIAVTRMWPASDPAKIYNITMQWRERDFSAFAQGEYLFKYPFQSGIILFYYLASFLFGEQTYIALQVVNLLSLMVIFLCLSRLTRFWWGAADGIAGLSYIALICWIPLFFFITYLYGILPGMACAVGALSLSARYLETRRFRYMAGAALCIGIATVLKMNCLIYLIAMACFLLYDAIDGLLGTSGQGAWRERKEIKRCLLSVGSVVLLCASVWGCDRITEGCVERLTGCDMPEGEPMISWIVMGLSEAPKGPGDYNGYTANVFAANGYDSEAAARQSLEDLRKILREMAADPLDRGLGFLARKTAYQWNDPTFISMERMWGRRSDGGRAAWVQSLIDGRGSVVLSVLLNEVQTLVWAGVLLWLFLHRDSRNVHELTGAVVFLGGYLFHTVWEAGASYTLPYFTIMIPYAVKGFCDWTGVLVRAADARQEGRRMKRIGVNAKTVACAVGVVLVLLAALRVGRSSTFHHTIALDDGQEAVQQYYHRTD